MLLCNTVTVVTNWVAARKLKIYKHPPYLPDLAPADFSLFPRFKKELAI
jgi:hypothetical protein